MQRKHVGQLGSRPSLVAGSFPMLGYSAMLFVAATAGGCGKAPAAQPSPLVMIGTQGTHDGEFVEPRGIAALPDGTFFVVDRTGRVQRFDASGSFEHSWGMPDTMPGKGTPSGIGVDHEGRVLVPDTHYHRVLVFDRDGHELLRFGEMGMGPGQFMYPTDAAADRDGNIYVTEYGGNDRVSKFSSSGEFILSFGGIDAGSAALDGPSGVAIGPKGNIWVADTGNHRICVFEPDGNLINKFGALGTKPGELRYPRGLAFVDFQTLAVADYGNNRVAFFDLEGRATGCWGHAGRRSGALHLPTNVAFSGRAMLIADSKNHRVVMRLADTPEAVEVLAARHVTSPAWRR